MKSNWLKVSVAMIMVLVVAFAMTAGYTANNKSAKAPAKPPVAKALPRLLDLGASKCIPCKMMAKVLDELKKEYKGKLKVDFIDVNVDTASAAKYKVRVIPLQIFFDAKGKELYRHEGYYPKADIVKKFKALGYDLSK